MTLRNLDFLFKPTSVAFIGAGKKPRTVGHVVARNLFNSGFDGPIMPVNPNHRAIEGVLTYPDVASLPIAPDLAVIATPPPSVPGLIEQLGARGAKAAVVITAGFGEGGDSAGKDLERKMLEAARPHSLRVVGPNCLGIVVPGVGLNASFAHLHPRPGPLAFIAQSGAMVTSVLDWAHERGVGFSHFVSLGDMSDVDFGDLLDYLAGEGDVRAILLYVEAIRDARKFMSAARAASRLKPVIVIKAGRHAESARAAASHTGALAGVDAAYDAAFRRAGMLRVYDMDELFDAVETLGLARPTAGDRLAILTNGGGIGVLATDTLMDHGGRLADITQTTIAGLDKVLPPTWSKDNPVDIIGDAPGSRYSAALDLLLKDPNTDAVLVLNCPTAISSGTEAARAVIDTIGKRNACVLTSWLGGESAREARRLFADHKVPTYDTPDKAVRAFMHMVHYRRAQESLTETPPSIPLDFDADVAGARKFIQTAIAEKRDWLTEPEAKGVLAAYGIPVVATHIAKTPQEAARQAADLAGPVAIKILSRDIVHKSDIGGVVLDLSAPAAVREAASAMLKRIAKTLPEASIDGFTVQPMVHRPGAFELIIGVVEDKAFGPLVMFGRGGTEVEVIGDTVLALPPLNMHLAREAMSRTTIHQLLEGYRGKSAVDLDAVAMTMIKVAQLVIDFGEVIELDINPLLADEFGVLALDARIRVRAEPRSPVTRLAIRPYPKELEETLRLPDGRNLVLRPVLPEDEPAFQRLFTRLSPEDIRMRFFASKKALSHPFAARMTQIDYDREMALVLAEPVAPGKGEVFGAVHIVADPDNVRAEYAIMIQSDMAGLGLGPMLMRRIIDYGRGKGLSEIYGAVMAENKPMLKLCDLFKFKRSRDPDDHSVFDVTLKL